MATATADRIAAALAQLQPAPAPEPPAPSGTACDAALDAMADAALQFGHLLTRWQQANGWSQDTPKRIAAAAGFTDLAVHNSQWSELCRGLLTPKPKLFAALAQLNRLVADQAWATPGVITPALRATLQQALPLLRPDGTPWSAADFFDAFIGGC
jgi:transcriptional regulator with XRE-family HTH domain